MPNYRRYFVPGGSYFFTLVTHSRTPFLCDAKAREILRGKISACQQEWPFEIDAIVVLPDHLHAIWSLPSGDHEYSKRWAWIKKEFTSEWLEMGGREGQVSVGMRHQRRRAVWQARFWEHTLRDEEDFERHFDYIHYNPVKHNLVDCPKDWPYSSFHRWVRHDVYATHWGCRSRGAMPFKDLDETAME